jgi:hypothetical protein
VVVEISRVHHREPEMTRWVVCGDCGSAIANYLTAEPLLMEMVTRP